MWAPKSGFNREKSWLETWKSEMGDVPQYEWNQNLSDKKEHWKEVILMDVVKAYPGVDSDKIKLQVEKDWSEL